MKDNDFEKIMTLIEKVNFLLSNYAERMPIKDRMELSKIIEKLIREVEGK